MPKTPLSHTAAKYLQAVNILQQKKDGVRQVMVAKHLGVRPSSCFESILRHIKNGLIAEDEHKFLVLTPKGQQTLKSIERNQYVFTSFFREVLDCCCEDSSNIAAKIEPLIDFNTSSKMCRFTRFLEFIKGQKVDFHEAWKNFDGNIETDIVCKNCEHQEFCLKRKR